MLEITKYFIDLLSNSNSIKSLLGGDVLDSRIYSWNPPFDVIYTAAKPAAIFYYSESGKRPYEFSYPQQLPDETYYFQVVSFDRTKVEQIVTIIFDLLDFYTFHTEHFSVKTMESGGISESTFEGTPTKPLYIKNIIFELSNIFRRASTSTSPSVSISRSPSVSISRSPSVSASVSASSSPSS